jgi:centrosomal protein CEP135
MVNEQLQRSIDDYQHRLSIKRSELESAQEQIKILEEKIGNYFKVDFSSPNLLCLTSKHFSPFIDKLTFKMTSQNEEAHVMKKTIGVIDKEKDFLQETVDEKTEMIANLQENLANKVCQH